LRVIVLSQISALIYRGDNMLQYFIPGLTPEQVTALAFAEIPFSLIEMDNERGILIDADDFPGLCEVLHVIEDAEAITNSPSICHLTVKEKAPEVIVGDWTHPIDKESFKQITKEVLLSALKQDVYINAYNTIVRKQPVNDGFLHIFIWSSPTTDHNSYSREKGCPETIFGHSTSKDSWNLYAFSEEGIPIADENGYIAAELIGKNLFILAPIAAEDMKYGIDIYRSILERALLLLAPSEQAKKYWDAYIKMQFVQDREVLCEKVAEKAMLGTIKNIDRITEMIRHAEEEVAHCRKKLEECIQKNKHLAQELKLLMRQDDNFDQMACDIMNKIKCMPKVIGLEVSSDKVVNVYTETLYCIDTRTDILHEIGKMKITFFMEKKEVRFYNLTRQIIGYQGNKCEAPHVYCSGRRGVACLGNAEDTFAKLLREYDIISATALAIKFIESANVDDGAGEHINRWPVAEKQERRSENEPLNASERQIMLF